MTQENRARPPTHCCSSKRQRGAALIAAVLIAAVGVGALFIARATTESTRAQRADDRTQATLARAKEALVARAVAHATHPGALPCPDTDNDGDENPAVGGVCPSYIGRLPWRTLGLDSLRGDGGGERLWYALSPAFRDDSTAVINSDTKGTLTVHAGSTALNLTTEAVAVIFAPGAALGAQPRGSAPASCATTGTVLPADRCPANYLETTAGVSNASASGPYITAAAGPTFNDRLLVLRTRDLMPLVEQRVAAELRDVLMAYRDRSGDAALGGGCNCYPWPDSDANGASNSGVNRGRIPLTALPHDWGAVLVNPATGTAYPALPVLPPYFQANGWAGVVYYAVGRNALQNFGLAPTACTTCTPDPGASAPILLQGTLARDSTIGNAVVLITPGSANASRPSASLSAYIDDAANRDADDRFVSPVSRAFDRDRIYTIPDDLPPASCAANAKTLIRNAPCHTTGNNVKPACQKAANNLSLCSCANAGNVMVTPPCRNSLNPSQCQAAVNQLQTCQS